jgi:toxin ParE1/3/4
MKRDGVVFTPEAEEQLAELYRYIEESASPEVALHYTTRVVEYCLGLETFPERGTPRNDIRPGLRTTSYKRRTEIAYTTEHGRVEVIGIFHGGRDYERALQLEEPDDQVSSEPAVESSSAFDSPRLKNA